MKSSFVFDGSTCFPASHAGAICELANGELLAAWYAGSRESAPDSVILGSRLPVGAKEWQPVTVWVDVAQRAAGNPRLFVGPDGAVWLIAPVNYGHWCDGGTRLFLKRSYDLGQTWTDLEIFRARRRILGKNKPLFVAPDTWILPMEYEGIGDICFMRSTNQGKTWQVIDVPRAGAYLDQPTVVQLGSGELLAYNRSWEGLVYATRSQDLGLTWSVPAPTTLLNPNSGIDMLRMKSGKLVLAYNPVALGPQGNLITARSRNEGIATRFDHRDLQKAGDLELGRMIDKKQIDIEVYPNGLPTWGPRTPLCLAVSHDEGETWEDRITLENEQGEFSYPSIIQGSDSAIHIIYTHQRTRMKHVHLEEKELL
jgi:predicted neuraminidase